MFTKNQLQRSIRKASQCLPMLTLAAFCFSILASCGNTPVEITKETSVAEASDDEETKQAQASTEAEVASDDERNVTEASDHSNAGTNSNASDKTTGSTSLYSASEYLPITLENQYDYIEDTDGTTLVMGHYPKLQLQELSLSSDGVPAYREAQNERLKNTVAQWNMDEKAAFDKDMQDAGDYAREDRKNLGADDWYYYAVEDDATLRRADDSLVSMQVMQYRDMGGAHPSTSYVGVNFDAKTGQKLEAKDIVESTGDLESAIVAKLLADYPDIRDGLLDSSLEESVKTIMENPAYGGLQFTLDQGGMLVMFSAYDLTAYAYGPEFVKLRYADYPKLFKKQYLPTEQNSFMPLPMGEPMLTSDGHTLSWSFTEAYTADGINDPANNKLEITLDDKSFTYPAELGYKLQAYARTRDNRIYLYFDEFGDNDWHFTDVFMSDGSSIEKLTGDTPMDAAFYDTRPVDPEKYLMETRTGVLGTEQIARYYRIGEDGLPAPLSQAWTYIVTDENGKLTNRELTLLKDLTLETVQSPSDMDVSGDELHLEKGAVLIPLTTNNTDTAICRVKGTRELVRIVLTGSPDDGNYKHLIDGREMYEVLDGMILAG